MINFPRSGGGLARLRPINGHSVGWVALARNRLPKWPISNWPEHLKDIFSLVLVNLHLDFSFFWSWELFYAISWMWCLSGICIFSESKLQMSYNELEFSIFCKHPQWSFEKTVNARPMGQDQNSISLIDDKSWIVRRVTADSVHK